MSYKLLDTFKSLFEGTEYRHRKSNLGDFVASYLYEDLLELGRSNKFVHAVTSQKSVLNRANTPIGRTTRRGDGTFGERVPHVVAITVPDYSVAIGDIATVEIGTEVKILAKAMIKQIDRVGTDMLNQVAEFRRHGGTPICVGIVGINCAATYRSFEGKAVWDTDGRRYKHPSQEAAAAEERLVGRVEGAFDELLILRFCATNTPPYAFNWMNEEETKNIYGAALIRISREYDRRF